MPVLIFRADYILIYLYIFIYIVFSKLAWVKNKSAVIIELRSLIKVALYRYFNMGYETRSIYPSQNNGWGRDLITLTNYYTTSLSICIINYCNSMKG